MQHGIEGLQLHRSRFDLHHVLRTITNPPQFSGAETLGRHRSFEDDRLTGMKTTAELVLGPLLRFVDQTQACVWVEVSAPARVRVLGTETATFSVGGRHYALVIVDDLEPGSTTEYEVHLDGHQVWPEPASTFPPSVIRTTTPDDEVSILFGSCRAAAPHVPPYTLEVATNGEARGVDTLWAHAQRMVNEPVADWPHLVLFLGDQIYADDSSPGAKDRIDSTRPEESDLPPEIVATYEEYCWLYHEAWSEPYERWFLSTVPSAMIFDDHDMIDDWNISESWVADIREEPWWERHALEGLMSYWVYQHLGNISPDRIEAEGLLAELLELDDGTERLRRWAKESEAATPTTGGYSFSYTRTVGDVTVVMIDCRNARVLTGGERLMVGPVEWEWVRNESLAVEGHLLLATSVPVFIANGLHDFQQWNEAVCNGALGRPAAAMGEKLRRALDLEDWSAFAKSYDQFVALIHDLRSAEQRPKSIVVGSGDIHFSYAARVPLAKSVLAPDVWQVVCSPIRNALIPPERGVMRFTLTETGARIGAALRRTSRTPDTRPNIAVAAGPFFANSMGEVYYRKNGVRLTIEQSVPDDDGGSELHDVANLWLLEEGP